MNSEHAALQLRMEDSRKDKRNGEKGLSTPNPHVDGGNGKKFIVYNTKEEKKEGKKRKRKKRLKEKERKKKRKHKELSTLKS